MRTAIATAVMARNDYMLQMEEELLQGNGMDPMDMEALDVESGVGSIIAGFRASAWDDAKLVRDSSLMAHKICLCRCQLHHILTSKRWES